MKSLNYFFYLGKYLLANIILFIFCGWIILRYDGDVYYRALTNHFNIKIQQINNMTLRANYHPGRSSYWTYELNYSHYRCTGMVNICKSMNDNQSLSLHNVEIIQLGEGLFLINKMTIAEFKGKNNVIVNNLYNQDNQLTNTLNTYVYNVRKMWLLETSLLFFILANFLYTARSIFQSDEHPHREMI